MARAHNIYIVDLNHHPIAAFTVKHECRTWLDRNFKRAPSNLRVLRLADGATRKERAVDVTGEIYALLKE